MTTELITPQRMKHQTNFIRIPKGDLPVQDEKFIHVNHTAMLKRRTDLDRKYRAEWESKAKANNETFDWEFWSQHVWLVEVAVRHITHQFRPPFGPQRDFRILNVIVFSRHPDAAQEHSEAIRKAFYGDVETLHRIEPHKGIDYIQWAPGL